MGELEPIGIARKQIHRLLTSLLKRIEIRGCHSRPRINIEEDKMYSLTFYHQRGNSTDICDVKVIGSLTMSKNHFMTQFLPVYHHLVLPGCNLYQVRRIYHQEYLKNWSSVQAIFLG